MTGCDAGRFGRDCAELCECDGAPCDPTTGQCLCPPGKTGEHCEKGTHKRLMQTLTNLTSNFSLHLLSLSQCVTAGFMVQAVLSCVSVHTEASVTSAQVTAHVLSPGWDPPVRKVRVCMCMCVGSLSILWE